MSNYCEPLLHALKECLMRSDCVAKDGNLPSDCLKNHFEDLPLECRNLRQAAFECKRGMVRIPDFLKRRSTDYTGSWICGNDLGGTMRRLMASRNLNRLLLPRHHLYHHSRSEPHVNIDRVTYWLVVN